ncbi:hypothetical protein FRC11_013798 [Ceratobasidium sp. 423]|nr:hypothetical protein FRC11_013798 [Ceratobasidium sp. 423]
MPGDDNMKETFAEWKDKYGDVVYVRVLGQGMVVLNSREAAFELLERRSSKYSDRPLLVMANELVGWGYSLAIMRYGERHKRLRKLFNEGMSAKAIEKLGYMLEHQMTKFIQKLFETPEELFSHVRRATNATVIKVTYGYNLKDGYDPILAKAEEAVNMFAYVTLPGIWLVDSFPFCEHIYHPSHLETNPPNHEREVKHLPWAPFKSKARKWQKLVHEFRDMPADFTIEQMARGNHEPSLMASWFERAEEQPGGRTDEVDLFIKAWMHIPGGCLLIPNIWEMSRDPTVYNDPEAFKPERFISTATHEAESDIHDISFGFGRRRCPGIHLARSSVWLAIVKVLAVYDIAPIVDADGQPIMPDLRYPQTTISGPKPFRCVIKPRSLSAEKIIQDSAVEA